MTERNRDIGEVFDHGELVDRAVRRGAERAVRRHRRLGVPLLYSKDGEIVEVDPWTVELPMWDPDAELPPPQDVHRCDEMDEALRMYDELCEEWGRAGRGASGPLLWGKALERVEKHRGCWFAHNREYAVPVRHCPFCGTEL